MNGAYTFFCSLQTTLPTDKHKQYPFEKPSFLLFIYTHVCVCVCAYMYIYYYSLVFMDAMEDDLVQNFIIIPRRRRRQHFRPSSYLF